MHVWVFFVWFSSFFFFFFSPQPANRPAAHVMMLGPRRPVLSWIPEILRAMAMRGPSTTWRKKAVKHIGLWRVQCENGFSDILCPVLDRNQRKVTSEVLVGCSSLCAPSKMPHVLSSSPDPLDCEAGSADIEAASSCLVYLFTLSLSACARQHVSGRKRR